METKRNGKIYIWPDRIHCYWENEGDICWGWMGESAGLGYVCEGHSRIGDLDRYITPNMKIWKDSLKLAEELDKNDK